MPSWYQAGIERYRGAVSPAIGATFSLDWVSSGQDGTGASTVTFASKALGAADANRRIAVFVMAQDYTSITSVTIGGVAASLVAGTATTVSVSAAAIYQADVPAGTTGNIVIVCPGGGNRMDIEVYRIVTGTPAATSSNASSNANATNLSNTFTVPSGGAGFSAAFFRTGSTAINWTPAGAIQDDYQNADQSLGAAHVSASGAITTTATCTSAGECLMASAAWSS